MTERDIGISSGALWREYKGLDGLGAIVQDLFDLPPATSRRSIKGSIIQEGDGDFEP
jgi:hypothetical protein